MKYFITDKDWGKRLSLIKPKELERQLDEQWDNGKEFFYIYVKESKFIAEIFQDIMMTLSIKGIPRNVIVRVE